MTGLMGIVIIMDMATLMDIMIITIIVVMMIIIVMADTITVIKITTITSIRIITIKTLEVTIKIPTAQTIVITGRTRNSNDNIIGIIIRKIMQIPETTTRITIAAIHTTTTGHQEAPLM